MAWFKAAGSIRHNGKRYLKGAVVELDAKEKKTDLFVPCDAPNKAEKAEPKAEKPKAEPKAEAPKTADAAKPKADAPFIK